MAVGQVARGQRVGGESVDKKITERDEVRNRERQRRNEARKRKNDKK